MFAITAFLLIILLFGCIGLYAHMSSKVKYVYERVYTDEPPHYKEPEVKEGSRDLYYTYNDKKICIRKCYGGVVYDNANFLRELGLPEYRAYIYGRFFNQNKTDLLSLQNKFVVVKPLHDTSATSAVPPLKENNFLRKCIGIVNIEHTSDGHNITGNFDLPDDISTEQFGELLTPYLKNYNQTVIATIHYDYKYVIEIYPLQNVVAVVDVVKDVPF